MSRSIEPYRDPRLPERFIRWIEVLRMRLATIPCFTQTSGSPEGVINGQKGDRYYDTAADLIYDKTTDTGNTGWVARGAGAAGGAPSRRNMIVEHHLYSDGADTAINFTDCHYDPDNLRVLISGNNSFAGTMSDVKHGKAAEFATLPSSVIANGQIDDIREDNTVSPSGVLARIGVNHAKAPMAGTPWTVVTPPFSIGYNGFESWKGTQLVAFHTRQGGPNRDYTVSTDGGVTWPSQFYTGINAADTGRTLAHKSTNDGIIGIGASGPSFAWSASTDLTAAVWNAFDFGALLGATTGNVNDFAWSSDDNEVVVVTGSGDVITSSDGGLNWLLFDRDLNPFRNGVSSFFGIEICVYVADLAGFVITDGSRGMFIPDSDLTSHSIMPLANQANVATVAGCRATDGVDWLAPLSANNSLRSMPKA